MMDVKALGRIGITVLTVAALVIGFLSGLGILEYRSIYEYENETGEAIDVQTTIPLNMRNRVEIYKNGELVYEKEGDPWTVGFAKLLTLVLFSRNYYDLQAMSVTVVKHPNQITTITEVLGTWNRYYPNLRAPVIGIGSSNDPPSIYDVDLKNVISLYNVIDPTKVVFVDVGNFYWLNISGYFTGFDATVQEVGLFVRVSNIFATTAPDQLPMVLLMRDVVSPAITLLPEDLLIVKYAIRIYKDVLVQYGFCDLVQVIFGLDDRNLRYSFPCPRVTAPNNKNWGMFYFDVRPSKPDCGLGYGHQFCVRARLATQSIIYTNRFTVTQLPLGFQIDMTSRNTEITSNSTHLIIRTKILFPVDVSTTVYGLALYRYSYHNNPVTTVATVTLTAYTTAQVAVDSVREYDNDVTESYLLMFVPFAEPITVPEGSRVRVTLELALPIS